MSYDKGVLAQQAICVKCGAIHELRQHVFARPQHLDHLNADLISLAQKQSNVDSEIDYIVRAQEILKAKGILWG
jgi:hypothetical protein